MGKSALKKEFSSVPSECFEDFADSSSTLIPAWRMLKMVLNAKQVIRCCFSPFDCLMENAVSLQVDSHQRLQRFDRFSSPRRMSAILKQRSQS